MSEATSNKVMEGLRDAVKGHITRVSFVQDGEQQVWTRHDADSPEGHLSVARDAIADRDMELDALRAENARLREALEFYANPETYMAIGFLPDAPCGEFIEDFDEDYEHDFLDGARPGKIARRALSQPQEPEA